VDVRTLLDEAARRHGDRAALHCGGRWRSYRDVAAIQERMAEGLRAAGARPGDRVAAFFPNCHLFLAAYYAALRSSLVLMPMNLRLAPPETEAVLRRGGARFLLRSAEGDGFTIAPVPAASPAPPGAEAVAVAGGRAAAAPAEGALLYFTSGSTGEPKGVLLTLANLAAHAEMTLRALRFSSGDVWLHAAPMFHLADAWAIFTATAAGAGHAFLPRWDGGAARDVVAAAGVTLTNLVPAMIPAFLDAAQRDPAGVRSLRLLLSGGAPIAPSLPERIETGLGCEYAQTYGLTETSPFLTFSLLADAERGLPPETRRLIQARTGRAVPGVSLRVVAPPGSERFEDVPADDVAVGEVVVRGATVTPGYFDDAAATAEAFRGGWFHTGDLATIDATGSIQLVDRAKDVIISGGETVYSVEVERALLLHPEVREAAVFAVPDDRLGEAVRAAVALHPGGTALAADLAAFCRRRIAGYKCPRAFDLLEALPRTGSGKIDKRSLRAPHWRGHARRIS
jgi:fatty-acyl-CoA synthase